MHTSSQELIEETVIEYDARELDLWRSGIKQPWLWGQVPLHVVNQDAYHFGEYYVLHHFGSFGWRGHRFYALGDWEPHSDKLAAGRRDLQRLVPASALRDFQTARRECGRGDGKGEPDLFLFRPPNGPCRFVEVKKGSDRISAEQLQCLAQICRYLQSSVEIVYLKRRDQTYRAKRYVLDLALCTGSLVHVRAPGGRAAEEQSVGRGSAPQ